MTNTQIAKLYLAANAGTTATALDAAILDGSALTAVNALSQTDFLNAAYQAAFGRNADAEGLAYWGNRLDNGLTTTELVDSLVAGAASYVAPTVENPLVIGDVSFTAAPVERANDVTISTLKATAEAAASSATVGSVVAAVATVVDATTSAAAIVTIDAADATADADSDAAATPTYTIAAAASSVTEGNTITFTVTASEAMKVTDTTLNYNIAGVAAAGGTADPLTDLGILNGTVAIAAGSTTGTITLTAATDTATEGYEGFQVSILDANFAATVTSATVAITDPANAGQSFTLTTGIDADPEFTGGLGDDTFTAAVSYGTNNAALRDNPTTANTWSALDNIDGGAGNDTLNINDISVTGEEGIDLTVGTITNIETMNIQSVFNIGAATATTLNLSGIAGLTTVNTTKSVDTLVTVGAAQDLNVSGATGQTTTIGGANVTVTQDMNATAGSGVKVNSAENVTITATDSVAVALGINVGAAAATGATGTIAITATGSTFVGNDGAVALDAIATFGGTTVTVDQTAAASYGDVSLNAGGNDVVTQGAVTVVGTANTTDVTVTQDASLGAVDAVTAVTGVSASQEITFTAADAGDAITLTFDTNATSGTTTLVFTASKDLTPSEVASAFANLVNEDQEGHASASLGLYTDTAGVSELWSSSDVVVVNDTTAKVVFTATNAAGLDAITAANAGTGTATAGTLVAGTTAVTAVTGVTGIANGIVLIDDDSVTNDNITTVTVDGYAATSKIGNTNITTALDTLSLKNSGLTITANTGAVTAAADMVVADTADILALSLESVGHLSADSVLTFTAAPLTLNVISTGSNYVNLTAAATTTLNVTGTGTLKASATDLAALETVVISGTAGLSLNAAVANTVTSVDTTATTGTVTTNIDAAVGTYTGGTGVDVVTLSTSTALTKAIDLGAGDDTLSFAALAVTGSSATLSAGEGTDTLSMATATADALDVAAQAFYTNFERLTLNDAPANAVAGTQDTVTINLENLGFDYVTTNGTAVDGTTAANATILILDKMANNGTVVISAAAAGVNTYQTVQITDATTGTADVLNIITNAATAANLGTLTADKVETLNLTVNDTDLTSTAAGVENVSTNTLVLDADKATSLDVNGAGNAVLTFTAATTALVTIDASDMTGAINVTTNAGDTGATTVTGGSAADTIILQGANDVAIGGAGNDTLTVTGGVASAVTLTGGEGVDTFDLSGFTAANGGSAATITDIASGETIKFAIDPDANFATGQVSLIAESTYSEYVQEAAAQADASATTLLGAAAEGGIAWFTFSDNTFIVQDVDGDGAFTDGADIVVKLSGLVDLTTASYNVTDGTLEIA